MFGPSHIPQFSWPQWAIPWVRKNRILALVSLGFLLLGLASAELYRRLHMPSEPFLMEVPFLIGLFLVTGIAGLVLSLLVVLVLAAVCDLIDAWKR